MRPTLRRRFTAPAAALGALAVLLIGASSTFAADVGARVDVDMSGLLIMPLLIVFALVGEFIILAFSRESDNY